MELLQNKKLKIIALLTISFLEFLVFAYHKHETKYDYEINQVLNYENNIAVPGQKKLTKQNTKIVIYDDPAENEHLISISFRYPNDNQANDWFAYYLLNNRSKFLQTFPDKINTLKIIYKKRNR
jgi:hypothetical protein